MPTSSDYTSWPTSRFVRLVHIDVDPSVEDDWNTWYNEVHAPEICACPGYVGVRRYRSLSDTPAYLAIYELTTPEAINTPELRRVAGWGPYANNVLNGKAVSYEEFYRYRAPRTSDAPDIEPATMFFPEGFERRPGA